MTSIAHREAAPLDTRLVRDQSKSLALLSLEATGHSNRFGCALALKPIRGGAKARSPSYSPCGSTKSEYLRVASYTFFARANQPGGVTTTPAAYRFNNKPASPIRGEEHERPC
jgi:hypothetical protein